MSGYNCSFGADILGGRPAVDCGGHRKHQ